MKFIVFLVVLMFWAVPAPAQELPIFDAHQHYSRGSWDVFTPDAVLEKMKKAGVIGALVSSTPDEGTQKLLRAGHARIVGGYRPYQVSADIDFWYKKLKLISRAESIRGKYRLRMEAWRATLLTLSRSVGWSYIHHRTDRPPHLALLGLMNTLES